MKPEVLKMNKDFRRLYGRGKYVVGSVLVTYCIKKTGGKIRFGITSGKKTGNAVTRNRCRRIIREAFRDVSTDITKGCDIVFVSRAKTGTVKTVDVLKEMRYQLNKLGVL